MKDGVIFNLTYFAALSILGTYLLLNPAPLDYHHLFAYLTVVGFSGLLGSATLIINDNRKRGLHLYFGLATTTTLVLTLLTHRYAILY